MAKLSRLKFLLSFGGAYLLGEGVIVLELIMLRVSGLTTLGKRRPIENHGELTFSLEISLLPRVSMPMLSY